MTPYDPEKHHRRSVRLKGYNYAQPGAYFITLVTHQRQNLFGEIIDGQMHLSDLGKIVQEEWMRSIDLRREIRLNEDEFTILPNHAHGIVWIVSHVGADGVRPDDVRPDGLRQIPVQNDHPVKFDGKRPGDVHHIPPRAPRSLSSFVAGFKSAVTSRARRELSLTDIWQRNYHDNIIRSQLRLEQIWEYIDTNVQRWQEDQLHPSAPENHFNKE